MYYTICMRNSSRWPRKSVVGCYSPSGCGIPGFNEVRLGRLCCQDSSKGELVVVVSFDVANERYRSAYWRRSVCICKCASCQHSICCGIDDGVLVVQSAEINEQLSTVGSNGYPWVLYAFCNVDDSTKCSYLCADIFIWTCEEIFERHRYSGHRQQHWTMAHSTNEICIITRMYSIDSSNYT